MIGEDEKQRRRESIHFGIDNHRLEGLVGKPDPEYDALVAQYMSGEMTGEEFIEQGLAGAHRLAAS